MSGGQYPSLGYPRRDPKESARLDRAEISAVLNQVMILKDAGRHRDACAQAVRLIGLLGCAGILDRAYADTAAKAAKRSARGR